MATAGGAGGVTQMATAGGAGGLTQTQRRRRGVGDAGVDADGGNTAYWSN